MEELIIYQAENGSLELRQDASGEMVWATQKDLAIIFEKDQSVISRHINNIFKDGEIDKKSNMQKVHIANSDRPVEIYSLDIILAVGYRANSARAIKFRQWATQTLKQHIVRGFTINENRITQNKALFLKTIEDLKLLTSNNSQIQVSEVLSLIQSFGHTWFSLDSYDKNIFPQHGTKQEIVISEKELANDLRRLKETLIAKGEATELFAQEKNIDNLKGILGSVFQSVFGQDAYETIELKAAHLLYFIIKNHPFNDGNKRCGAFSFIWFLQKARYDFRAKINPETLATVTILIAESQPYDKEKMIGVILLLLNINQS